MLLEDKINEVCKIKGYDKYQKEMLLSFIKTAENFMNYPSLNEDTTQDMKDFFVPFMALVIMQLDEFSKGKKTGPLFDLIKKHDRENYNCC